MTKIFMAAVPGEAGYSALGSAEGIERPAVSTAGNASSMEGLRALWGSYLFVNLTIFLFAAGVFISLQAITTNPNIHGNNQAYVDIYSWYYQGGFQDTSYNIGLAIGIAITVLGALLGLAAAIPQSFALIAEAIEGQRVNGYRTIMDIAYDAPIFWFFCQSIAMRDCNLVIFAVIFKLLANYVLHVGMDKNNNFLKTKNAGAVETKKKSYYMELGVAGFAYLAFYLLMGSYYVDILINTVQHATPSPIAFTGIVSFTGIVLFLTDFWRVFDYFARYARMDTGCFQHIPTGDTVHAWLTWCRVILIIIQLLLAGYCHGTSACVYITYA